MDSKLLAKNFCKKYNLHEYFYLGIVNTYFSCFNKKTKKRLLTLKIKSLLYFPDKWINPIKYTILLDKKFNSYLFKSYDLYILAILQQNYIDCSIDQYMENIEKSIKLYNKILRYEHRHYTLPRRILPNKGQVLSRKLHQYCSSMLLLLRIAI